MEAHTIGTAAEAAEIMGYTPGYIRLMCKKGRVKGAWKQHGEWVVPLPPEFLPPSPRLEKSPKG